MHGAQALPKFIRACQRYQLTEVLDIGAGKGAQAAEMAAHGLNVTTVSLVPGADYCGDYNAISLEQRFGGIWACHVLEHQPNAQAFLRKLRRDALPGAILAVTVPPAKHEIVGGHLSLWNAGLLVYHLVLAGIDCAEAKVLTIDYDITVLVRNEPFVMPPLTMANADSAVLELPFDRYYMQESLAPEAESAYAERLRDERAWVTVRLHDGHAVLEELWIDDLPIREYLARR